jgi:CRISPR system Cascade subunit CasB
VERPFERTSAGAWRFAAYLAGLAEAEDRAALAALRRGLGKSPGEAAELYPYVVRWVPDGAGEDEEAAYYLIASLFALHPAPWPEDGSPSWRRNLGASLARLAAEPDRQEAVERRFVALLNAHRDDLSNHLRRVVGLLKAAKAAEIPVDWAQLLTDVRWWDGSERRVQRRWARAFWGSTEDTEEAAAEESAAA